MRSRADNPRPQRIRARVVGFWVRNRASSAVKRFARPEKASRTGRRVEARAVWCSRAWSGWPLTSSLSLKETNVQAQLPFLFLDLQVIRYEEELEWR